MCIMFVTWSAALSRKNINALEHMLLTIFEPQENKVTLNHQMRVKL